MPTVHMLCGPICSGKSTWQKDKISGRARVSLDDLVDESAAERGLTYNEVWSPSIMPPLEARMMDNLSLFISEGRDIVWDQTNLSPKIREGKMKAFDDKPYLKVGVFFVDVTKDLIAERNVRPGKIIPDKVVDSMLANYVIPEHCEPWFDMVFYVSAVNGNLKTIKYNEHSKY